MSKWPPPWWFCGKCDGGWVVVHYRRLGIVKRVVCRCVKAYWHDKRPNLSGAKT